MITLHLSNKTDLIKGKKENEGRCKNMLERKQITIRLPADLKTQIQQQADKEGQSFNTEVIILLWKGLEVELGHVLFHRQR